MKQEEVFQSMSNLLRKYEEMLSFMDRRCPSYPDGNLSVLRHGDRQYYRYNMTKDGQRYQTPVPVTTPDGLRLLKEMQEKRAVLHGRPILRKNIEALQTALERLRPYIPSVLPDAPPPTILSDDFYLPGQLNVEKWIADTRAGNYRTNPYKLEQCKIPTADGHMTRSKSEERWCDILAEESLLYRYECSLRLVSGRIVYPDFTVLHPTEKRLVYIEHFGLMDIPKYAADQMQKLEDYADSGLTHGRDLFYTTETKDRPLTRDRIYKVLYRSGLLCATS